MDENTKSEGWRQHFPTYDFKDKEIVLEEYRSATKTLESDERVFLNAANISIVIGAAFGSLVLGTIKDFTEALSPQVPPVLTLAVILFAALFSGVLFLRYFANRQKDIVFAARKVIVLRRMLGMSYGRLHLVLPNWRAEGADEPFSIKLFPGWNTYVAFPCYVIAGISCIILIFLQVLLISEVSQTIYAISYRHRILFAIIFTVGWFIWLCWLYRKALLDSHERVSLLFAQWLSKRLYVAMDMRTEHVIYRAKLAVYELERLKITLNDLKKMAVQIEDKQFYSHAGLSWRGFARMMLYALGLGRRSGGSTITQQVARSLFIFDQQKIYRRKVIEIILAKWLNSALSKDQVLDIYLASVRFETGILGVAAACRYFFW